MSRGPRRLLDDPDFRETGCNLADEQSVVGNYDLTRMRQAVLERVGAAEATQSAAFVGDTASTTGLGGFSTVIGVLVAGLAVVGGAFWFAGSGVSPTSPPDAVVAVPSAEALPPVVRSEPEGRADAPPEVSSAEAPVLPQAPPPAKELRSRPTGVEPSKSPGERVSVVPPQAEREEGVAELVTREDEPTGAPPSPLQLQINQYDQCLDSLDRGRHRVATECFRSFLHAYPQSSMRQTAEFALLRALKESGDVEGTAALAERMADRPENSTREEELRRLQAQSLAKLGRCDHALQLARELPSSDASAIRKACRKR